MFSKLKTRFSKLAKAKPGRRFAEHHERHRQSESRKEAAWKTAAYLVAGFTMLLAGLLLSLPPEPQPVAVVEKPGQQNKIVVLRLVDRHSTARMACTLQMPIGSGAYYYGRLFRGLHC